MRRAVLLLIAAAACHSNPPASGVSGTGALTGADNPRTAVERFLAAARAQDMQAISAVWGNDKGSQRDQVDRQELEKREVIMIALLRHDQANISAPQAAPGGRLKMTVDLKQGSLTASPVFTVVRGPSNRWYVEDFDTQLLQNKGFGRKQ
ncbi:MAG TPA: hypothetical protein VHE78_12290 [Gemmatimonadaceae bacterium]|nr:hypothetical protein [Gemmatimonadaceae bacterium]